MMSIITGWVVCSIEVRIGTPTCLAFIVIRAVLASCEQTCVIADIGAGSAARAEVESATRVSVNTIFFILMPLGKLLCLFGVRLRLINLPFPLKCELSRPPSSRCLAFCSAGYYSHELCNCRVLSVIARIRWVLVFGNRCLYRPQLVML